MNCLRLVGWLLAAGLILAGCVGGIAARRAETPAARPMPTPTPDSPFGVSMAAGVNDPAIPVALELAAGAGIRWLRVAGTEWSRVEPRRGQFDWRAADRLINLAHDLGYGVLAPLAYTPEWASGAPEHLPAGIRIKAPPRDLRDWEAYVEAVVSRYKGRVRYWQVWNEPDLAGFWQGTPRQYAELLAVTYRAVKKIDPDAYVVFGGLALGGTPGQLNSRFLEEVLGDPEYPGAAHFDIADFHHYGSKAEAQRRYNYIKSVLEGFGVGGRPIWVTEVGYSSDAGAGPDHYRGGESDQAEYLRTMVPFLLGLGVSRVFWFDLYDDRTAGSRFWHYGLVRADGTPKPALDAYRQVIAAFSGRGLRSTWGLAVASPTASDRAACKRPVPCSAEELISRRPNGADNSKARRGC